MVIFFRPHCVHNPDDIQFMTIIMFLSCCVFAWVNPQRVGTELIRFNIVNIMVVDDISTHDIDYVE